MTSREASLAAENVRLRQLLADAGLKTEEAAASAASVFEAHAASLAEGRQEVRAAHEGTQRAREAAAEASTEHQAEAVHQKGLYAAPHTSEGRLRLILESASDFAIFTTDLKGRVAQ